MTMRGHYWYDGMSVHKCEICRAAFTKAQEATLPEMVQDDGREGRFCPSCRCDLVAEWTSHDEVGELEAFQVNEWRYARDAGVV